MITFTNVGCAPHAEECVHPKHLQLALEECTRYMEQIARHYPPPKSGWLSARHLDPDQGGYFEVMAHFDDEDPEAAEWVHGIENDTKHALQRWDTPPPDDHKGKGTNWPLPPDTGPVPWTVKQERDYRRKLRDLVEDAPF